MPTHLFIAFCQAESFNNISTSLSWSMRSIQNTTRGQPQHRKAKKSIATPPSILSWEGIASEINKQQSNDSEKGSDDNDGYDSVKDGDFGCKD